jgi:uncharacterized membrane protein
MSDESRRLLAFATLLGWCALLLFIRIARTGSPMYAFLVWNLFLAAIPAAAAGLLVRARTKLGRTILAGVWLAFLPNAPYLVTDLMHLRLSSAAPVWFDIALLVSCAATGLLLGYTSLADVQRLAARRFGEAVSWLCAAVTLVLCAFGIYLGRFLRWNSWDILTDPSGLFTDIGMRLLYPLSHPRTLAVTLVYGGGLIVGYVAFRLLRFAMATHEPAR